ncbi:hypothetical protein T459_24289 [Capsicum annuum]|uniref:Retrotransposon gag domain-containing protein n=1 Tax=Capsicum annuum TaxID=4072 RepID=A0A2G2YUX3_CAPAN|nr:hypothetical protein T459_24289 [Capsicum annuum]
MLNSLSNLVWVVSLVSEPGNLNQPGALTPHGNVGENETPEVVEVRDDNEIGNCQGYNQKFQIDMPEFDGQGLKDWLYSCEQFFDVYKTPKDLRVKLASCKLDRRALQWHQSFMKHRLTREWLK